jgi:hypothetical protein
MGTKFRSTLYALALAAFGAVSCSGVTAPPRAEPAATANPDERAKDAFLWLRNIDGFNSIDDEHIVVSSGSKRALVKLFGFCEGLRFAETIAIDAPLGYLDRSSLGHVVYRRGFHDVARCPIDRVVAVKDLKEARALVEQEKAEKEKQKGG